jgi:Zn finger protein HypA/HybF involved in hydrogenase expression
MAQIVLKTLKEQTTCYKCEAKIEAIVGQVHPLCDDCQNEFDDWLQHEMGMLGS